MWFRILRILGLLGVIWVSIKVGLAAGNDNTALGWLAGIGVFIALIGVGAFVIIVYLHHTGRSERQRYRL